MNVYDNLIDLFASHAVSEIEGDNGQIGPLKVKEFTGLQRIARETIEKHEIEQALRDAQFALDVQCTTYGVSFCRGRASCARNISIAWRKSRPREPKGIQT